MIRLADLADPSTDSWAAAEAAFRWAPGERYNIATDCLANDPDSPALVVVDERESLSLTFGQLDDLSSRFASLLGRHRIGAGDRVAVKLPQSAEMAIAILGALRLGAVVVPVSNVLGDDAIGHRLHDSGAGVLVCAGDAREQALAEAAGTVLIPVSAGSWAQGGLDGYPLLSGPDAGTGPDDPGLLLYTSGTTGKSKGVLHAHRVLLGHHAIDLAWDHVRPGDVSYSPVDWSWAGGLFLGLLVPLAHGMTVVAYRETHFDPARTVAAMRAHGVSVGLFPPTALRLLQRSGELTGETMTGLRLRSVVTGAEAVEPELARWAREELGLSVNNAFGQTEANALIGHAHVLGDLDPACLGRPYPGHRVEVLDQERRPVPVGETGELAVRADDPVCMLCYWNAPESTAAKFQDGWLLTGDSGHRDADGNLFFHGRADDIIKSGGYRLGPAEIEAAILLHPQVRECAVVGLPDPERGQVVTAFVTLVEGAAAGTELTADLQARVRSKVGAHAYPRQVHYLTSFARTTTGKIDRRALKQDAVAGTVTTR